MTFTFKTMAKWPLAALVALLLATVPVQQAHAEDIALKKIMRNALYGGAVGALVGTAFLAFVDNPGDNIEFITTGAAAGVLIGAVWGAYDSSEAYVSLEGGRIHAALPSPTLQRRRLSVIDPQQHEVLLSTKLFAARF